jgi:hypothetical protein
MKGSHVVPCLRHQSLVPRDDGRVDVGRLKVLAHVSEVVVMVAQEKVKTVVDAVAEQDVLNSAG